MFKNASPYKFATCKPYKEQSYKLKLAQPSATSNSIAASPKWVAAPYGGGSQVVVVPTDFSKFKRTDNPEVISAHGSNVADLAFNPFNGDQLATGGEDGHIKVWDIPADGITKSTSEASVKVTIGEPVRTLAWHPAASGIIAVGHKGGLSIVDVADGKELKKFAVSGNARDIISVAWNTDGSKLAALGKNSALHVFDPREAKGDALDAFTKIETTKPQNVLWLDGNHFMLLAQDKSQKPYYQIWDSRDLSKHKSEEKLNYSAGYVLPLFDNDTNLVYLAMRGSSMIQSIDSTAEKGKDAPNMTQGPAYGTDNSFKGYCLMGKGGLDLNKCEINRIYTLADGAIESYGIFVPRKNAGFQDDVYPPTRDVVAALSGAEWFGGANKAPKTGHIQTVASRALGGAAPASEPKEAKKVEEKRPETAPAKASVKPEPAPAKASLKPEPASAKPSLKPTGPESADEKATEYAATEERKRLDNLFKSSPYRHLAGKEPTNKEETVYQLQTNKQNLQLCKNLRANSLFYALPLQTAGGSALMVEPHSKKGRAEEKSNCIRGHKTQVTCFDLNQLDPYLVATASQEGAAKIWRIPSDKGLDADLVDSVRDLVTDGKITVCNFSEDIGGLLATASSGFEGHIVRLWDVEAGKDSFVSSKDSHPDQIFDVQFDGEAKLIASSCRDKKVRVFDPRANKMVSEFAVDEGMRDTQIVWVSDKNLITIGFGSGAKRSISLWDAIAQKRLHYNDDLLGSNSMIPYFDWDSGVLFVTNNGGSYCNLYQVSSDKFESLNTYKTSGEDFVSHVFLHKTTVDPTKVEIVKSIKLTKDKLVPISWTVPRKRTEFFQDDLFPPTRAAKAGATATEWFKGAKPKFETVSLQPKGMTNLSEAPPEATTERQERYQAHLNKKNEPVKKGILGHSSAEEVAQHFTEVAKIMPKGNRWDAKQVGEVEIAEEEWD